MMRRSTTYHLPLTTYYSRKGFTIVELLIFTAIFAMVAIAFIAILIAVTRVQVRQFSVSEVAQQSQFLLRTIQNSIETSSLVDMSVDVQTSTLKLRFAASGKDPTYLYASGTAVYLKETDLGAPQALTTSRVNVTNLGFTKRANPSGHDSVSVSFTVAYNTENVQQKFSQALSTAIARVSAATFDSDIRASTTNTYKIGASTAEWQSFNNTIFFSGSNVGIGATSPQQKLEIDGGLRLNTTLAKPTCSAAANSRGTFWVAQGGAGVKDAVEVCVKNASDTYLWAPIY